MERHSRPSAATVVLALLVLFGLWFLAHTTHFLSLQPDPAELALFSAGTPVQGRDFDAGLFVRHEPDGKPLPGQEFKVEVHAAGGAVVFALDGKTDKHGFAAVKVPASRLAKGGDFKLVAQAGESKASIPLKPVPAPAKCFISMDKEVYVLPRKDVDISKKVDAHVRVLVLDALTSRPLTAKECPWESLGARMAGELFETQWLFPASSPRRALSFGIWDCPFSLSSKDLPGTYVFKAGGASKTFEVVNPPSELDSSVLDLSQTEVATEATVETSKGFYFPDGSMSGTVRGAPNAAVKLRVSLENPMHWNVETFYWGGTRETLVQDSAPKLLAEFDGKTDDKGVYQFAGKAENVYDERIFADHDAVLRFDAELSPGGSATCRALLTTRPYRYACFPEGGTLVAGKTNRVHFLVFNPDGAPANAVKILLDGELRATTGPDGAASIELAVGYGGTHALSLEGANGKYKGSVDWGAAAPGLALVPSQPLCDQGDTAKVELRASADGVAFVEVLKEGIVADAFTVALRGGSGSFALPPDNLGWGDVELRAGALLDDGNFVTAANFLRVRHNRWFKVEATPQRLQVSDQRGNPVRAGVSLLFSRGKETGAFELQPPLGEAAARLEMAKLAAAANAAGAWWQAAPSYPERAKALDLHKRAYCERLGFHVVWGCALLLLGRCLLAALRLRGRGVEEHHFVRKADMLKVAKLGAGLPWLAALGMAGSAAVFGAYLVKGHYVYVAFHAIPTTPILWWALPCLVVAALPLVAFKRNFAALANLYPGKAARKRAIAGVGGLYEFYLAVCVVQTAVVMLFPGIDGLGLALYLTAASLLFILLAAAKTHGNVQASLICAGTPSLSPHGLGNGLGGEPASNRPMFFVFILIWAAQCVLVVAILMTPLAMFMPLIEITKKLSGGESLCVNCLDAFSNGSPRDMDYAAAPPLANSSFALRELPPEPPKKEAEPSMTLDWELWFSANDNDEYSFRALPAPPWTLEAAAIDADGRMGFATLHYTPQKRAVP